MLELDCGSFEVEVESWEALATAQKDQDASDPETFSTGIAHKQALAFLDRNDFEEPWRRVFVVQDTDGALIHLFSEDGECVNEDDTPHGRHQLHTDDTGFLAQWRQGYYSAYAADGLEQITDADLEKVLQEQGGGEEEQEEQEVEGAWRAWTGLGFIAHPLTAWARVCQVPTSTQSQPLESGSL